MSVGIVQQLKTLLVSILVPESYLTAVTTDFVQSLYNSGILTESGNILFTENNTYLVWE